MHMVYYVKHGQLTYKTFESRIEAREFIMSCESKGIVNCRYRYIPD